MLKSKHHVKRNSMILTHGTIFIKIGSVTYKRQTESTFVELASSLSQNVASQVL